MKLITHIIHKVILAIDEKTNYAAIIAKKLDCTYSTAVIAVSELIKYNVVEISGYQLNKRRKLLNLTKKGKEIQNLLIKLRSYE